MPTGAVARLGGRCAGRSGLVVEGTDANFQEVANASVSIPLLLVLWAAQVPESRAYLDTVVGLAAAHDGRLQVVSVDVEQNLTLMRAFQVQSVPVTMGLVQGQPVPMFAGVQPAEARPPDPRGVPRPRRPARRHGPGRRHRRRCSGRRGGGVRAAAAAAAPGGLRRDRAWRPRRRHAAYTKALKENPADADAELGLAQVGLMQRTEGADLQAAAGRRRGQPHRRRRNAFADLDVLVVTSGAPSWLIDLVAPRAVTSASRPGSTSCSCSPSSVPTTSGCARPARPS